MAIIECEHVAGGSQATIACGTCARAEGFAAGRLAAVQDALKLCRAMTELLDELPMTAKLWGPHDVAYKLEQQIAALAQHATAVASEPRSEAAECTASKDHDGVCVEWPFCKVHGNPGVR